MNDINEMATRRQPFTGTVNDALYSKYFGREREERLSAEIQRETQKILKEILEEVLNTNHETAQYSKKLQGYSQKLNAAREIREIQHIIKDLLEETGKMENASSGLQKKLEEATDEAQKLRQKLEKKEREALLDVLTGLHNRKAFGRTLQELHDAHNQKYQRAHHAGSNNGRTAKRSGALGNGYPQGERPQKSDPGHHDR